MNAVLFDLDNTLVLEDESTFRSIREAAARRLPADIDREAFVEGVAATAERLWKDAPVLAWADRFGIWWGEALWGGFSGDDPDLRAMRAFVPGFRDSVWRGALAARNMPADRAAELSRAYIEARRSRETIDADAENVLADLARDHRLGLVTNGAGDVQREKLSRTPFARYFAATVISSEAGVGKPDPAIFLRAADALGVAPSAATMVGDSLQRDVAGAHAAGMRTIWIDRGLWKEKPVRPDARIEKLSVLRAQLDELERRPASPPATT